MKPKQLLMLILCMLIASTAYAYDFEVDGIYYNITNETSVSVTYKDTGYNSYSGNIVIPESVTYSDITYSVTSIGKNAIRDCSGLTSINIPESVTTIGERTFYNCSGLTSITLPESVTSIDDYAFFGCSGLTSINIPESVTAISQAAFYGCSSLTSINIPGLVTSIGISAFSRCSGLTSITIPESVTSIDDYAFNACTGLTSITIPESVTSIGNSAFWGCSGLTSITLPESVTSIDDYAFSRCSGLTSINIPESVTSISGYAFSACTGLTSITIPESVTSIGECAFSGCIGLTSITIPESVTSIGGSAFSGCSGLTSITIPESVTSINSHTFSSCIGLTSITIPKSVTSIGTEAFKNCTNLKIVLNKSWLKFSKGSNNYGCIALYAEVVVNNYFGSFDGLLFSNISNTLEVANYIGNATRIYIPSEFADIPVTTIASNAFYGCIKLTDVTIPQSVISMGNSAFGNTNALIHLESCTPVDYVFNSNTIIVPQSALSAYREAWPEHANEIVGDGFPENLTLYVEALTDDSGIIKKIDELAEELEITELETLLSVTNLKLIGSINSYDVMVLHNKMINLTELDLSDVDIVANSYQYYSGRSTQDNKITTRFLGNFPKLQTVKLPNSAKTICSSAIEGNSPCLKFITIGSNTETIESSAFQSARTIINVKFGDNLRTIGNEAFLICTSLQTVEIGQNVSLIGYRAFEGCSELKKVTIHDDAPLVISDYAFKDCSNLNEIYLGKSTISIGNYAFQKCTSLKTAIMGEGTLSIGNCAFNECADLSNLTLGENVEIIGDFAFSGCSKIETLIIPKGVTKINQYAFSRCTGLREVRFSPGLKTIDMYAFQGCKVLQEAMLPSTVESIGANAFSGCSSLTSVKIPTSMKSIADNAFNAYKVRSVYTWTIEPTNISQNTFATDTYTKGVLYVPATAKKLYFYNTQWSRFIDIRTFDAPYQYFYLKNEDLVIDEDTPRLKGGEDETFIDDMNVDADLNTGSGLVVEGDESQNLGEVNLDSNGTDSGTILGGNSSTNQWGSNVNIDNLNIRIAITKNKWYFFCFPFDITPDMVQFDGQYVWRYYDGAERALFGHGGWKNASGTLHSGQGYIFQGSVDGTLVLNVGRAHMGAERKLIELAQHVADNLSNSSWNFVGNPYTSYYDIADLGYNAPVTIWNGNTYEAFHPDDDTKMLYPYQAFFVQKPSITDNVEFLPDFRLTLNQSKDDVYKESLHNRHQSRMRRAHANQERYIVNVDVADANDVADRTRVVFNDTRSVDYEIECDAAKFMSSSAPQLYSIGDDGTQYSINERPMGNSIVKLGFYAPADGIYTFSTSREDYEMEIVDQNNGTVTALSEGYTFYADKGTDNGRFILRAKSDVTTGIDSLIIESQEQDGIDKYDMGGLKVDDNHRGIVIEKTQSGSRRVINK